ncbi:2-amino-4-hydroxy-6-hydroxymethyldihydropteridine diphosphokinase [Gammaproteobacteria bacterium 45_16_T64]|nr:2-amino-4-hydroxy-6-hydroxymethyldihydropteridine diphosphokinase [Gammaproteobacteria bacterium 45_16_T64]
MSIRAFIGLGSNLDTPLEQITQAIQAIGEIESTQVLARSPLYSSKAIGPGVQPDYVNGVLAITTALPAESLLRALQYIENQQGRVRGSVRWVARTLDLDILLFGEETVDTEVLCIPHPRMTERNFVLYPLRDLASEIAPALSMPNGTSIIELAKQCSSAGITPFDAQHTTPV